MAKNKVKPSATMRDWVILGMPLHVDVSGCRDSSVEAMLSRLLRPEQSDGNASAFTTARNEEGI
ncbi:hypothetical protein SAMN04488012_11623 [Palleronia salina]|uniref:Uncharacterized protein n=1 Tax=Palleronia salina TaxID=313368 RepID=A0A1M6LM84_9RHOB|nr:hypothetical protein SAMN04488012_11623 [Palleronia salina]